MAGGIFDWFRKSLQEVELLHPLDRGLAKRWVKERLKRLFPELASDPEALEKAYNELGIEAREGTGKGAGVVYEISLPGDALPPKPRRK